jgi:hypothetical protein
MRRPGATLFLDFKLTGRKKLRDEFETQGTILLILQYTIKRVSCNLLL